jgi:hypothetical protein
MIQRATLRIIFLEPVRLRNIQTSDLAGIVWRFHDIYTPAVAVTARTERYFASNHFYTKLVDTLSEKR